MTDRQATSTFCKWRCCHEDVGWNLHRVSTRTKSFEQRVYWVEYVINLSLRVMTCRPYLYVVYINKPKRGLPLFFKRGFTMFWVIVWWCELLARHNSLLIWALNIWFKTPQRGKIFSVETPLFMGYYWGHSQHWLRLKHCREKGPVVVENSNNVNYLEPMKPQRNGNYSVWNLT